MVQRRDAVGDVERRVAERQILAVGLHAAEVAVERAAAEADVRVDEDVGRDVLAVAFEPEARRPGFRGPDLEHAQTARPPGRSGRGAPGTSARSRASSCRSSRARGSRTGAHGRPRRRARTSLQRAPSRASPPPRSASRGRRAGPRAASGGCRRGPGRRSGRSRCTRSPHRPREASFDRRGSGGSRGGAPRGPQPTVRERGGVSPKHPSYSASLRFARDGRRGCPCRAAGESPDDPGPAAHPSRTTRRRGAERGSLAQEVDAAPRRERHLRGPRWPPPASRSRLASSRPRASSAASSAAAPSSSPQASPTTCSTCRPWRSSAPRVPRRRSCSSPASGSRS